MMACEQRQRWAPRDRTRQSPGNPIFPSCRRALVAVLFGLLVACGDGGAERLDPRPELRERIRSGAPPVVFDACCEMLRIGCKPEDRRAVRRAIVGLLDSEIADLASDFLFSRRLPSDCLEPEVLAALRSPRIEVRRTVAGGLGTYFGLVSPRHHAEIVRALAEALEEDDEDLLWNALHSLAEFENAAAPAVPEILRRLDHESWEIRTAAGGALMAIGPLAEAAVTRLVAALDDERHNVIGQAWWALVKIGPGAVTELRRLMREGHEKRWKFARMMKHFGDAGRAALPELRAALDDEYGVRIQAAESLLVLGERDLRAIEILVEALSGEMSDGRRRRRITALGCASAAASAALPEIRKATSHENADIRAAARVAVGRIEGELAGE